MGSAEHEARHCAVLSSLLLFRIRSLSCWKCEVLLSINMRKEVAVPKQRVSFRFGVDG